MEYFNCCYCSSPQIPMEYEEMVLKVSGQLGMDSKFIDKVYKSYWRALREYIKSLPLKEDLSEEAFMQLRPNINVPSLGKFYVTYDRYKRLKEIDKQFKKSRNVTHQEN